MARLWIYHSYGECTVISKVGSWHHIEKSQIQQIVQKIFQFEIPTSIYCVKNCIYMQASTYLLLTISQQKGQQLLYAWLLYDIACSRDETLVNYVDNIYFKLFN